jgi:Flp pilus assembly protein TadG
MRGSLEPRRRSRWIAFRDAEDGSATIEACLWIPFFFSFFILVLDATFIFLQQADAQRIVQDGNRQYVSKSIGSLGALETWIETAMQPLSSNAVAMASIDPTTGILTTRLEYPAEDTDLTGTTGVFGGLTMRVQAVHLTEQ